MAMGFGSVVGWGRARSERHLHLVFFAFGPCGHFCTDGEARGGGRTLVRRVRGSEKAHREVVVDLMCAHDILVMESTVWW